MIDPRNLKKISDVLNSEGSILALYHDPQNNLYFGSFLTDGTGIIFYSVNKFQINDYLKSKLTLVQVYINSVSFLIKHKFRNEIKTYLKDDFKHVIQCGDNLYKDLPNSMKSKEIELNYGS